MSKVSGGPLIYQGVKKEKVQVLESPIGDQ